VLLIAVSSEASSQDSKDDDDDDDDDNEVGDGNSSVNGQYHNTYTSADLIVCVFLCFFAVTTSNKV